VPVTGTSGRVGTAVPARNDRECPTLWDMNGELAETILRLLAKCRPEGAALPAEIHRFVPVLRAAGLLQA
jgi:hypothetical protein